MGPIRLAPGESGAAAIAAGLEVVARHATFTGLSHEQIRSLGSSNPICRSIVAGPFDEIGVRQEATHHGLRKGLIGRVRRGEICTEGALGVCPGNR